MKFAHIRMNKWILFYLFHSIYFNFKYLPFKQAIKLPILLYKPRFLELSGKVIIKGPIKTGMIQIGFFRVPLYPDTGCMLQINGTICFNGRAKIGNDSKIVVSQTGTLTFGENFNATSSLKIVCYKDITFDKNNLVGWDNMFMDYDFHKLTSVNYSGGVSKGYGTIHIGHDSWFANGCRTYKNVQIPAYTTISANTILTKTPTNKEYCIIGSNATVDVKREGLYHDYSDDKISIN
ncbi:hypothetical protein [uncultured Duncaniella sp.]|uniref:hypothetical protein n=2 Tax=uncultured Duncaniella sp. TaxID=2768039 RepID=UPI0026323B05|nr:hypothetical protein [uncultured Duncaniella sp.]